MESAPTNHSSTTVASVNRLMGQCVPHILDDLPELSFGLETDFAFIASPSKTDNGLYSAPTSCDVGPKITIFIRSRMEQRRLR
jgi:hypothetical protein